jgi:phosphoribosylanthranilate isomerase
MMSPPKVKVCGIMNSDDLALCLSMGADMVGFVSVYPKPVAWNLTFAQTEALLELEREYSQLVDQDVASCLLTGGSPEEIIDRAKRLHPGYVQLCCGETVPEVAQIAESLLCEQIGVIAKVDSENFEQQVPLLCETKIEYLLLDPRNPADPGRGGEANAELYCTIRDLSTKPVILAGGITGENIDALLEQTQAGVVDVLRGSETSPGHKDTELLRGILRCKSRRLT